MINDEEYNSFLGKKTLRIEKEVENENVKETNLSHMSKNLFQVNEVVPDNKLDIKEDIESFDSLKSDKNKEKKRKEKQKQR